MEQEDKRRKQSAVRLYLTVLYLIIKNLVYINARYFLAFHCLERDRMLIDPKKWKSVPEQKQFAPEYGFAAFAAEQLRQYPPKNRRVAAYLEQNFANSDAWPIRAFRNKVEHLDAVRNADLYINDIAGFASWFELYHYVLQRRLMAQFDFDLGRTGKDKKPIITEEGLNPKTAAYFGRVRKYRTYCKDFVKALNVPFAYNLPRYKNLTVDALFDRNRLRKTDGAGTLAAETEDTQD